MGIYVSLGKCILSSLLPAHGYDLLEHSLSPVKSMSCGEQQNIVCVLCPCACFSAGVCVVPEGERALVQLSGSDYDLTRPLFVHMRPSKLRLSHCGHAQGGGEPACMCLCVSESARFTHVTTVEAAGALSCFARLRRAAARWLLRGLCLLHA